MGFSDYNTKLKIEKLLKILFRLQGPIKYY